MDILNNPPQNALRSQLTCARHRKKLKGKQLRQNAFVTYGFLNPIIAIHKGIMLDHFGCLSKQLTKGTQGLMMLAVSPVMYDHAGCLCNHLKKICLIMFAVYPNNSRKTTFDYADCLMEWFNRELCLIMLASSELRVLSRKGLSVFGSNFCKTIPRPPENVNGAKHSLNP